MQFSLPTTSRGKAAIVPRPNVKKCNLQVPKLPIRPPKSSHRSRTGRIDRSVNESSHRAVRYGPISSGGRISSTACQGWVESACRLALGGAFAWHPHLQKERGGNAATITNPKTVYGCQRQIRQVRTNAKVDRKFPLSWSVPIGSFGPQQSGLKRPFWRGRHETSLAVDTGRPRLGITSLNSPLCNALLTQVRHRPESEKCQTRKC
jgi:hypothetical protein